LAILDSLITNSTLKRLYLNNCVSKGNGGDKIAMALSKLVSSHPTLETLSIAGLGSGFYIGAPIIKMFEAIAVNNILLELDIQGNRAGDKGIHVLGEALKKNRSITSLKVDNNQITVTGLQTLVSIFPGNRSICYFTDPRIDITKAIESAGGGTSGTRIREKIREVALKIQEYIKQNYEEQKRNGTLKQLSEWGQEAAEGQYDDDGNLISMPLGGLGSTSGSTTDLYATQQPPESVQYSNYNAVNSSLRLDNSYDQQLPSFETVQLPPPPTQFNPTMPVQFAPPPPPPPAFGAPVPPTTAPPQFVEEVPITPITAPPPPPPPVLGEQLNDS